jgi:MinD superfamily P-loop ATPase
MSEPIEITVISGKGGTGKTVLTSCLAAIIDNKIVADCDVDAPDLHLLLKPTIRRQEVFLGGKLAAIDAETCTSCGKCLEVCRFGAVTVEKRDGAEVYSIDDLACEGCGVCAWMCPAEAIGLADSRGGKWFVSDTAYGKMVHACLGVAQENSGKLVTIVRKEARRLAIEQGLRYVLIDGPPGIGCPVIASVAGVHMAVVVTEPTLSGVHDLERVLALTQHFGVKTGVVINKHDLNNDVSHRMEGFLSERKVPVLGKIPFSSEVNRAIAAGETVIGFSDGEVTRKIKEVAQEVIAKLSENQTDEIGSKHKGG